MSIGNSADVEARPLISASELQSPQSGKTRKITPELPNLKGYPYCSNIISNAKYNAVTFFPILLYEQFKFFFNLYFLLVALSQAWPPLQIGYLSSYVVPLVFVLAITMGKEAFDDIQRRRRDRESNSELYELANGQMLRSDELRVGHIVTLHQDQRAPADCVVLKSSEHNGETFIRTDQLDGETDWKLRTACTLTQSIPTNGDRDLELSAAPPEKNISSFYGTMSMVNSGQSIPLTVDNTVWANCVIAAGTVEAIIVYTGPDTRMALNTSRSRNKVGLVEVEVNGISKVLCACVFLLSFLLVLLHGMGKNWYVDVVRFLILFSTIIPVSLRVNLDMAKSVYAYQIEHDEAIKETIVRTSTIPEDLGRIEYLLTDKTGTITQNEMDLKKIHVGQMSYSGESMEDVEQFVHGWDATTNQVAGTTRSQREIALRVCELVLCLSVCHSVTPTDEGGYQAVSPDEIAIVGWTATVGIELVKRDRKSLTVKHNGQLLTYKILYLFPFNSDSKRMGIVVEKDGEYWFYQKGADTVMIPLIKPCDWLEEEVSNMAREGLRTLVIASRQLDQKEFNAFAQSYSKASLLMHSRDEEMQAAVSAHLEKNLNLLGVTGVEDKLQHDVKPSLELLRNAGIKIWMLTGDKVETAKCVAVSSKLVARGQHIYCITNLDSLHSAHRHLDFLENSPDSALLMDGHSLQFFQQNLPAFGQTVLKLPVVIACRCTPQQKADLTSMVKRLTGSRVCAIGDGGNDVSMIQAADVGIGIVGKEGKQASLAADFSIVQFSYLTRLLLWHGRNSYKRSAKLAQFVIHRGLVISACQAVYSVSSRYEPLALYQGWLMVGYATCYTMMPVFALVTDRDVDERVAKLYPELYKELKYGRNLSYRSFFIWTVVSLYQGIIIQGLSQIFVGLSQQVFKSMVFVSFTALIFNELLMVAIEVVTWNYVMIFCELATIVGYIASVPFLGDYFNLELASTLSFYWKTAIIIAAAVLPRWLVKTVNRRLKPPNYAKVQV